jgi:hypothetical protein
MLATSRFKTDEKSLGAEGFTVLSLTIEPLSLDLCHARSWPPLFKNVSSDNHATESDPGGRVGKLVDKIESPRSPLRLSGFAMSGFCEAISHPFAESHAGPIGGSKESRFIIRR